MVGQKVFHWVDLMEIMSAAKKAEQTAERVTMTVDKMAV